MFKSLVLLLILAVPCYGESPAVQPDFNSMDAGMLKAYAIQCWGAANAAVAKIDKLKKELGDAKHEITELTIQLTESTKKLDEAHQAVEAAERETEKWKPADRTAKSDLLTITVSQLENMGEKFVKRKVRMGVYFRGSSLNNIDELPGVTLEDNGLQSVVRVDAYKQWIGFSGNDGHEFGFRFFALKKDYGDMLTTLPNNTPLILEGVVVELKNAGKYGFCCYKIRKTTVPKRED